jgi:hypothetical protein
MRKLTFRMSVHTASPTTPHNRTNTLKGNYVLELPSKSNTSWGMPACKGGANATIAKLL